MNTTPADGGTDWELAQAELAMVAAGDDPAARALAMRRHAEAIRNMMQGAIVPMFVGLVERSMGEKIAPVASGVEGLRTDVQQWASESATRLGKLETRMDESERDRAELRARLERIEQILAARPHQREQEHRALLAAITEAHGDGK